MAASTSGGNPDYFYDFYVPLTAFNGGITATTPLRMTGMTVTSAQSGLTGTVSDVGGVNFQSYGYNKNAAWSDVISTFPPTTLNQIQAGEFALIQAIPPVVSGPITANSTSITGTSAEAAGSVITVYRNGVAICGGAGQPTCPTVSANGTWTLTGISSTLLTAGNTITATVTATGKAVSALSNTVTVAAGVCTATPAPTLTGITGTTGSRYLQLNPSFTGNQIITVYNLTAGTFQQTGVLNLTAGTSFPASSTGAPAALVVAQNSNYVITATPTDAAGNPTGCQSLRSNQLCYSTGGNFTLNPHIVTITGATYDGVTFTSSTSPTWSEVPTNLSSINVTINFNGGTQAGNIVLYRNGVATNVSMPYSTSTTTYTLTISGISLAAGDVLAVRTVQTAGCAGPSTPSNFLTVQETTSAPTINQPPCGLVTTLSGTSSEAAGTTIQFYTGGTAGQRNGTLVTQSGTTTPITATVTTQGTWAVNLSAAAGGGISAGTAITARAKAPGKVRSVNSAAVTSAPAPTGIITLNGPIIEGQTTISGTAPAGTTVTLYIEGTPFNPVVTNSSGVWTVSGLAAREVFAGASITASYRSTDDCESARVAPLIVQCRPPATNFTLSASPTTICGAQTTNVTLSGSEYGISYRLLVNGTESGSSVLGTGGPITLVSGPITNTTTANTTATLSFRARKISGTACDATSTNTASVTVRPQPISTGLSFSPGFQQICSNQSTTFTLTGTNANYNYQLVNEATNQVVGTAVQGSSSGITLATGPVTTNTTYGLRITIRSTETDPCSITLANQVTVFTIGPSITRAVFPTANSVCVGGNTLINVSTQFNDAYTYRVFRSSTSQLLGTFTGNGEIVSVPTGSLNTAGTETFHVTVTSTSCGTQRLLNEASVTVTNNAVQANAGPDMTVCGTTATLQGNNVFPSEGTWRQVSGPSTVTFSNPLNPNATASNLVSGTYVLSWTVSTTCNNVESISTDEVTITVNCPATYTIAVPKYRDEYVNGEVLARATDPDGAITAAQITQGTLPPGTTINATTGTITVTNAANLVEGTYPLTIRLTDASGSVTITNIVITIYGDSPSIVPLPVELVYFTATVQQGQVNLKWLTASEKDNKEFVVERSADGKAFESIGTVEGNGNSSMPIKYSFADTNPLAGTSYYRLKQVDYSGERAYSKVIAVSARGIAAEMQLQVYPNPFNSELNITVTAQKNGSTLMQLIDMQGRVVHYGKLELRPGLNELTIPLHFVKNGMYILRLSGDDVNGTVKVLKH